MINKLPGELIESFSVDSCIEDDDQAIYDESFLNRINTSGLPPHRLALKKSACIILIKNLDVKNGHVNGRRYIITEMTRRLIECRKLNGGDNAELLIPRIPIISIDSILLFHASAFNFQFLEHTISPSMEHKVKL